MDEFFAGILAAVALIMFIGAGYACSQSHTSSDCKDLGATRLSGKTYTCTLKEAK